MSNKILLVVDSDIACIKDSNISKNSIQINGFGAIEKAKADAEQIVKDKCIALIDEILECDSCFQTHSEMWIRVSDIQAIKEKL